MSPVEPLIRRAFQEATSLRQTWVGAEHLLIAIANDPDHSIARVALAACAVDGSALSRRVASFVFDPPEPRLEEGQQPSPNPHFYWVLGRAEGFAYAASAERPSPEHLLLALIWDDRRLVGNVLETVGRTPAQLQVALAKLGAQVPERAPPAK